MPDLKQAGKWSSITLNLQNPTASSTKIELWIDGKVSKDFQLKQVQNIPRVFPKQQSKRIDLSGDNDFTFFTRFKTTKNGTLFSKCNNTGRWIPKGKTLYIEDGALVYDIGWLGEIRAGKNFNDGKWHSAVVTNQNGTVTLYADGQKLAERKNFSAPDQESFVFKIGEAADNFGGAFSGTIQQVAFSQKLLQNPKNLSFQTFVNQSDFSWKNQAPKDEKISISTESPNLHFTNIQIRPLPTSDLKKEISSWSELSMKRGQKVYNGLCITCHGDTSKEGALPTAIKFHEGQFKNGSDPLSIYNTLTHGYGQMLPQAWMTDQQKMDVINYIRETQIFGRNDSQYFKITPQYLDQLPKALITKNKPVKKVKPKPYLDMNFGDSLTMTLELQKNNIVKKGIISRLDQGDGGVSKGNTWAIFDQDTLQLAGLWQGKDFIDWRSIAFDGSHGTHPAIKGELLYANPQAPGWANPDNGSWEDLRFIAKDKRRYGPLPKTWAHYKGLYHYGDKRIHHYSVGESKVLDCPTWNQNNQTLQRILNISNIQKELIHRVAPTSIKCNVISSDQFQLYQEAGFHYLKINAGQKEFNGTILLSNNDIKIADFAKENLNLKKYTNGGPNPWTDKLSAELKPADDNFAYVKDEFLLPQNNSWKSWMRLTGIDFINGGKSALICTWEGEVWQLDGITQNEGQVTWTRIATGLYQPLGLKVFKGKIYVGCRDQIAILNDLNNDGAIDYYENFNNDHQVTEHYHEFAMGLQTDKEGNFYYAKSARHAKEGLVPHHGTLLKVSADGAKTEIIANGFRAANGVCVNDDGSFFVTDQEGHWTPKNRINWVQKGGFYGNYLGYHNAKSSSDTDMQEPMIWLTNKFNRSPGELMWAKSDRWGPLAGQLLELSYGMGQIFLNLIEDKDGIKQGGQIKIPNMDFNTGIMRGRFNPRDGQLYALGMFSWAANKRQFGGFYRVRYTNQKLLMPTELKTTDKKITLSFPESLGQVAQSDLEIKSWHIERTKSYGSPHQNERTIPITSITQSQDNKTLTLHCPDLKPTRCMSIKGKLKTTDGKVFDFEINNTIHHL